MVVLTQQKGVQCGLALDKFLTVHPRHLFVYFCSFQDQFNRKIVDFSGVRTQIVGVEGMHVNHLTTTTTLHLTNLQPNCLISVSMKIVL